MPKKRNFLDGQQNYDERNGQYLPNLVGKNGKVVTDADGDGKEHESWEKDFSPEEVKKMKNEYPGKEEHIKKLKDAGFSVDEGYKAGNTFKIDGKDFGDKASISIGEDGKYFIVTKNGGSYTYKDLDTAIDRAKYISGKAPSEDAIGWETGSYDAKTEQEFLMGKSKKQEKDFEAPKKHDYSEIFDEDYQRAWGVPDFKDEDDIKTLNDIVEKAMEYDGDDGAIDISNNAMERIGELTKFTEEEQDKLASGTGEEIMDILRSKEKKELTFEGVVKNADDDVLDEQFGKDTPERKLVGAMKEQSKPSLKDRRKEWRNNLSKSGDEYNKGTQELYRKLKSGEISRKEYNQGMKALQEQYIKLNTKPQRDRLAVDDELEGYDKQFKSIREELDPLEDEDSIAFNRHLMFNEPYDESKKNPRIAELNKQLKDVKDKRTDARRRLAKELGSQFGRKDYRKEIDSGELPSGNDRVYAMYQKSLEEPYLDFKRMIANDVYDNVEKYPRKLEFEDDLYTISKSGGAYDHYKKEKGKWVHISTGTIAGLGDDLGDKLEEENLK